MGVSLYYTARRGHGLSEGELHGAIGIAIESDRDLFDELNEAIPAWKENGTVPEHVTDASEICEGLVLYRPDALTEPGVVLAGSTKVSHGGCGDEPMLMQLEYYTGFALGRLRRFLPDAEWHVHLDDVDLVWDEETGEYSLPAG
ncbi:hypothetical protein [Nocardiopsis composta]|uniref:Uncharacterized protein n=1 Tax=Nocardiopsis composta TaxID=157465 RepID=A0A7W8QNA7_9ACTN|nr:hypothetical protein [Nocardiopsis composta]MBB5433154.1 hypothetical protein [Nocardiopsis composta]